MVRITRKVFIPGPNNYCSTRFRSRSLEIEPKWLDDDDDDGDDDDDYDMVVFLYASDDDDDRVVLVCVYLCRCRGPNRGAGPNRGGLGPNK